MKDLVSFQPEEAWPTVTQLRTWYFANHGSSILWPCTSQVSDSPLNRISTVNILLYTMVEPWTIGTFETYIQQHSVLMVSVQRYIQTRFLIRKISSR